MSILWTSDDAVAATGGRSTADWQANGVSIDTRTLQPGDLFVALKAARDGHDFVVQALEKGAAAALVSHIPEGLENAPLLVVDDVLGGLERLGIAARARSDARVIAVTGSVGKTSTKEMLRAVLAGQGRVHAAEASYNNHWGVPLTLARMPAATEFAVIEIGMNHPGEIAPLSVMARPHVAMVTIVAPAHLAAFESLEGIAHEKASIVAGLEPGGVAVLNGDLGVSPILGAAATARDARILWFGEAATNDHRVTSVTIHDTNTVAQGHIQGDDILFKVPAPGRHYIVNAMAVLAVADALDLDRALAITDLARWQPGAGRGAREVIHLDPVETQLTIELIDDSYNANPASLGAALEVLAAAKTREDLGRVSGGRRIAYLGDMRELGRTEAALHSAIAALPAMDRIDRVHCVGLLMGHLYDALPPEKRGRHTATSAEMADGIRRDLDAGDAVLVKGSLSMGLAAVVDAIRKLGQGQS